MTKVLMTRPLPETVQDAARALFDLDVRQDTGPMSAAEMQASLRDYDGVVPTLGDLYTQEIFDAVPDPRCRVLANFGVGYNHIDTGAARAADIAVSNTPGAVTDATADTAMTLMLMSARRAGEGERIVRAGTWEGWHPTQLLGMHLGGKTVGIVGMGRIGQAIARRCHYGFGMKVAYHSRSAKDLEFPAERSGSLPALAGSVDVLVIAVPGGDETHHLINADIFDAMQGHAHLINIARGNVVEESALIKALQTGKIAGAGLDVYEFEPVVPEALKAMENAVLLPHIGTAALEVRTDMGMMTVENLKAFFAGKDLPNAV
ncbi:D-glycerate dehydrogenase [Roseobacter ponti]|uniref:D-glycerate dehydrogenase n=2 Tax=Roseobacter ponti TaxID=1891787 RepID=A0A858SW18_9RHOB|nr:D-glycerate dehydrogenase [Roseobacter ponti]QJF52217.1 D-glycerate dehydrogenase [Roseobacter ponti]